MVDALDDHVKIIVFFTMSINRNYVMWLYKGLQGKLQFAKEQDYSQGQWLALSLLE